MFHVIVSTTVASQDSLVCQIMQKMVWAGAHSEPPRPQTHSLIKSR